MALSDLPLEELRVTLLMMSNDQRLRALAKLSPEKRQALFEHCTRRRGSFTPGPQHLAASSGLSVGEAEALLLGYDEYVNYLWSPETEVDRRMKAIANQVSQKDVKSLAESREHARTLSNNLFEAWAALNTVILSHEGIIRKRWLRMSKAERKTILVAAWPNMSARHRPDMDHWQNLRSAQDFLAPGDEFLDARIWPYINLEDLLPPTALLLYLNSRAHHQPVEFAYSDLELAPLFKARKEFLDCGQSNSKDITMAFIGRSSALQYGEFIVWPNESSAAASIKAGRTVHITHGIQILTIQLGIWTFLCKCVGRIIINGHVQKEPLTNQGAQRELEQDYLVADPHKSLEVIAREAPYRLPTHLDLTRLQALASAQKRQAIDHAIALREDPSYFVEVTERYKSHRPETVHDQDGNLHPLAKDFPIYNRAQRHMATDAHCAVFLWHETHKRLTYLRMLSARYATELKVEEDLPADLFEALTETRFFLENISLDLIGNIKFEFRSSPHLRKYHFSDNPDKTNLRVCGIWQRPDIDAEDIVLVQVLKFIRFLEDKGLRDLFSLHVLLDEVERLMQDEPRAKALITPHLASSISQLSIISECLYQLHQFQPWARKIESTIDDNRFRLKADYDLIFAKWGKMIAVSAKFVDRNLFDVGNPADGKFRYPVE